jgi:hypothetical protein
MREETKEMRSIQSNVHISLLFFVPCSLSMHFWIKHIARASFLCAFFSLFLDDDVRANDDRIFRAKQRGVRDAEEKTVVVSRLLRWCE